MKNSILPPQPALLIGKYISKSFDEDVEDVISNDDEDNCQHDVPVEVDSEFPWPSIDTVDPFSSLEESFDLLKELSIGDGENKNSKGFVETLNDHLSAQDEKLTLEHLSETTFDSSDSILNQIETILSTASVNGYHLLENSSPTKKEEEPRNPILENEISKKITDDHESTTKELHEMRDTIQGCLTKLGSGIDQMSRLNEKQILKQESSKTIDDNEIPDLLEMRRTVHECLSKLNTGIDQMNKFIIVQTEKSQLASIDPQPPREIQFNEQKLHKVRYERASSALKHISQENFNTPPKFDHSPPIVCPNVVADINTKDCSTIGSASEMIDTDSRKIQFEWDRTNSPLTHLFQEIQDTIKRINGYSSSTLGGSPKKKNEPTFQPINNRDYNIMTSERKKKEYFSSNEFVPRVSPFTDSTGPWMECHTAAANAIDNIK